MIAEAICVLIESDADIVAARLRARELAKQVGFNSRDVVLIATAISEVTRNIVTYARCGEVTLAAARNGRRRGITVVARDDGPGIGDLDLAMRDGFSTGNSLGLGLPGARRLMDEFEIVSTVGTGTTVTMRKWLR